MQSISLLTPPSFAFFVFLGAIVDIVVYYVNE